MQEVTAFQSSTFRAPSLLATPTYVLGKLGALGQRLTQQAIAGEMALLPHLSVLATLDDFGPLAQRDLAARIGINGSHLVGYVDDLEKREAVSRERDANDRRRQVVTLTPAGRKLLERLRRAVAEVQERFLASLSERQRATLMKLLVQLLDQADEDKDPDVPQSTVRSR